MQKRVQRKEVDVKVSIASSPVSAKLPAGAPSPSRQSISKASAAAYQLPDPNDIAQRYGLPPDNTDEADNAALAIAQEHSSKIAEYDAIVSAMRQKVDEKNRKIEQLCVLLEALEPVPGVDPTRVQAIVTQRVGEDEIDLRDGKIVSLAKKSHRLTQQLNKEKATNDRLTQDLEEYRRRCDVLTQEVDLLRTANAAHNKTETKNYNRHSLVQQGKKDDEEQSAAQIQRTLRDNAKSMEEMKSRIKELSEENKGLARALQRELGDGVSLEQAVDGGWRGRAQQIIMLKSKVKNLEATIQQYQQQGSGGGPSGRSNASVSSYNTQSNYNNNTTSNVDAKACEDIQEMSRERRQVVEALTEERVRLVEQNQQLEKKNQATKARVSILENEIKKLKESLTIALDKSGNDDQLIEALRGEIQRLQTRLRGAEDNVNTLRRTTQQQQQQQLQMSGSLSARDYHHNNGSNEQLQAEIQRLQRLCRNQSEQLDSQDVTIRQLRKKLEPY